MTARTQLQGVTLVQNVGTAQERAISQVAVPLHRHRMVNGMSQEAMVRVFNEHADDMHKATLASRSAMPTVLFDAVPFVNGKTLTLPNKLQTAAVSVEIYDKSTPTSGSPDATWVSKTDSIVTLKALGTFTANVRLTQTVSGPNPQ